MDELRVLKGHLLTIVKACPSPRSRDKASEDMISTFMRRRSKATRKPTARRYGWSFMIPGITIGHIRMQLFNRPLSPSHRRECDRSLAK